mmetsp:Transcript_43361/g.137929  ORF Transcript_43361/g.137929 Transcript_43361/m.137929 type:complete len:211 (+) Transcript_43361:285-917(+)
MASAGADGAGPGSALAAVPRLLLPRSPRTRGRLFLGSGPASSTSPASLPSSLGVSPAVSSSLRVSLTVSLVLSVSMASDCASLSPVASVSEAPLAPVSEAADEASERYFSRSTNSPGGRGRRQTGRAGEPVACTAMLCMGLFLMILTAAPTTAAAFATSSSSDMLQRPNFTPMVGPAGMRNGVLASTLSMWGFGLVLISLTGMGALSLRS